MKGEEEATVKVTYVYELPAHKREIWLLNNAEKMRSVLDEIYTTCRQKWKHGDDEKVSMFAEEIGDMLSYVDLYGEE